MIAGQPSNGLARVYCNARANDIAALALYLASDAAKAVSGQVLPIDGDMQRNSALPPWVGRR